MEDKSDAQLLRDYAERGQETAFREIVTRHTDLVYSAALRQVNSPDLAGDIAQGVFLDLARKAKSLGERMGADASVVGWLFRSTRYAALNHLRDDRLRAEHERQAMEQLLANTSPGPDWERIRPFLDEALTTLNDDDRDAVLLRYFKNQDFRAVGLALGISDDTAQKRVSRAVERLRELFAKRGITVGAGGLAVVLSANAVQSAPVGLAASISAAALAGVSLVTGAVAAKTIALTMLQKSFAAVLIAAAVGTSVYEVNQARQSRGEVAMLERQQATITTQSQQLQRERDDAIRQLAALRAEQAQSSSNTTELLRLRSEAGRLRKELAEARKSQSPAQRAAMAAENGGTVEVDASISGAINYKINYDLFFAALDVPTPSSGTQAPEETLKIIRDYLNTHGAKLDPADTIFLNKRLHILAVRSSTADTNAMKAALAPFILPDRKPYDGK